MRVGLVTPGFSASETDWCIPALLDFVRTLARDHDVYVLALRYPSPAARYQVHGATVETLGGGARRGLSRLGLLAHAVVRLRRETRRRGLEVLHALWAHEPGAVVTRVGRDLGVPSVVSILGGELVALPGAAYGGQLSWSNRYLTRTALEHADAVTVGSSRLQSQARRYTDTAKISLAPLGVDTQRFSPDATEGGPRLAGSPSLLCVASWVPVKDQATLLEALALTASRGALPDAHLHLVGSGPCEGDLRALTDRLGLDSCVTFHGEVPHERLPDYYRAADVCVLSSLFESQAMVVLEAAACGRVTIGTRVGLLGELGELAELAELAEMDEAPAAVPSGEPRALAALLTTTLRQPPWPQVRGRARLVSDYGLQPATDRFVSLYRRLLAHPRPGS